MAQGANKMLRSEICVWLGRCDRRSIPTERLGGRTVVKFSVSGHGSIYFPQRPAASMLYRYRI